MGRPLAQKAAKPHIDRLERLGKASQGNDAASVRKELYAALDDIVTHNRLDTWFYSRDLMNEKQLGLLKQARDNIILLPERSKARISQQALYDQLPDREKLLATVNRELSQGVENAIPKVEEFVFQTDLGIINSSSIELEVRFRHKDQLRKQSLVLNLDNPAETARALANAFG